VHAGREEKPRAAAAAERAVRVPCGRAAVPPVPLAATRNGPLCVCVPCSPAHTVGVQLVRKGPLELGAGGGAARAPQAAVSAAAHHRVRDRRAEGERRAARLGAGARRGRSTRCVRGGAFPADDTYLLSTKPTGGAAHGAGAASRRPESVARRLPAPRPV